MLARSKDGTWFWKGGSNEEEGEGSSETLMNLGQQEIEGGNVTEETFGKNPSF